MKQWIQAGIGRLQKKEAPSFWIVLWDRGGYYQLNISCWTAIVSFKGTFNSRTKIWVFALCFQREGGWYCLYFIYFALSHCCLGRNGFELLIVYFVFIRAQTYPVLSHSPSFSPVVLTLLLSSFSLAFHLPPWQ